MLDVLLMSICSAITSQQEVLIVALKNLGHDDNPHTSKFLEKCF